MLQAISVFRRTPLQGSSTPTSIVVGLVGGDVLSVRQAIPIIMGVNIGTTATKTLVSMAHLGNRVELERAFAGATVHDVFNLLSVGILFPLEMVKGGMSESGEGGLLFKASQALTAAFMRGEKADLTFASPTKEMVGPFTKVFLNKDKNTIKALSFGAPYGLSCGSNCTKYCVSSSVSKAWKKVAKEAYESILTACNDTISCDTGGSCYTNAGHFFEENIQPGRTVKGGFLKDAGDVGGGIILSLAVMCAALLIMVQLLHRIFVRKLNVMAIRRCSKLEAILMLLGLGLTLIFQSSSVTTPIFTPFVGIGLMPVRKMLPMTLGAWGPPSLHRCESAWHAQGGPKNGMFHVYAWRVAPLTSCWCGCARCLLIVSLFSISLHAGLAVTIEAIDALVGFVYWWSTGGCNRVLSEQLRDARKGEMEEETGKPHEAAETDSV